METLLRITFGQSSTALTLDFQICESAIARRWFTALSYLLRNQFFLEKNFSFLGWNSDPAHQKKVYGLILESVDFLSAHSLIAKDLVDQIRTIEVPDQQVLNRIHFLFEQLIGQIKNPSDFFIAASIDVQYQVLQLNWLCHELESMIRASAGPCPPCEIVASFCEAPRGRISLADHREFVTDHTFGQVYLKYSQLGKSPMEVAFDNDQEISNENSLAQEYFTGEFVVSFSPSHSIPNEMLSKIVNNTGSDKPIGRCLVARLIPPQGFQSERDLIQKIGAAQNIRKLELVRFGKLVSSCEFRYTKDSLNYSLLHKQAFMSPTIRKLRTLGFSGIMDV